MIYQPWKERAATGPVHRLGVVTTRYESCLARSLVLCLACLLHAFFFSQILLRRVQNFKWNQVVRWMNILRISRCEYFQSMCYWWFFSKTSFKWNHISKTWFILLRCSPQKWSLRSAVDLNSAASLTSCHLTLQILMSQLFYYNSIPIRFLYLTVPTPTMDRLGVPTPCTVINLPYNFDSAKTWLLVASCWPEALRVT